MNAYRTAHTNVSFRTDFSRVWAMSAASVVADMSHAAKISHDVLANECAMSHI